MLLTDLSDYGRKLVLSLPQYMREDFEKRLGDVDSADDDTATQLIAQVCLDHNSYPLAHDFPHKDTLIAISLTCDEDIFAAMIDDIEEPSIRVHKSRKVRKLKEEMVVKPPEEENEEE